MLTLELSGFFAGITIECDDVILDLNDHELKMDRIFYYQQPFFSIIELESQPFLPQQGPGFFGADPTFASNVVIKNGILGPSSHHGIHGNRNNNILIENVQIKGFFSHGIQLNGFDKVTVRDVEIGPNSRQATLNGNYGQMRLLMPILVDIAKQSDMSDDKKTIQFTNRDTAVTMYDLLDILVAQMDMALDFALNGNTHEGEEYWDEAVKVFINPSGLSFGAVTYGMCLVKRVTCS